MAGRNADESRRRQRLERPAPPGPPKPLDAEDADLDYGWWPPETRHHARYVLVGCMGIAPSRREHVFDVIDYGVQPARSVGFMPAWRAAKKFGAASVFMSASHGVCPDCLQRMEQQESRAPTAKTPPDAFGRSAGGIGQLGIVWFCRTPRTEQALMRTWWNWVRLSEDLDLLIRARYLTVMASRRGRKFTATRKGVKACDAWNRRVVTAARRRFRGPKDMSFPFK